MKRLSVTLLTLWIGAATLSAQTFMQHLTEQVEGQGTVIVHQDPAIDDMVNGKRLHTHSQQPDRSTNIGTNTGGTRARKVKARGFRIQVFWGGSTQNDRNNAQQAGARVKARFPELDAYTTFESPNWRCRVGDFATQQEADDYLLQIQDARLVSNPFVVRSEVLVQSSHVPSEQYDNE